MMITLQNYVRKESKVLVLLWDWFHAVKFLTEVQFKWEWNHPLSIFRVYSPVCIRFSIKFHMNLDNLSKKCTILKVVKKHSSIFQVNKECLKQFYKLSILWKYLKISHYCYFWSELSELPPKYIYLHIIVFSQNWLILINFWKFS